VRSTAMEIGSIWGKPRFPPDPYPGVYAKHKSSSTRRRRFKGSSLVNMRWSRTRARAHEVFQVFQVFHPLLKPIFSFICRCSKGVPDVFQNFFETPVSFLGTPPWKIGVPALSATRLDLRALEHRNTSKTRGRQRIIDFLLVFPGQPNRV